MDTSDAARELGRLGGVARRSKLSAARRREIAAAASKARWASTAPEHRGDAARRMWDERRQQKPTPLAPEHRVPAPESLRFDEWGRPIGPR